MFRSSKFDLDEGLAKKTRTCFNLLTVAAAAVFKAELTAVLFVEELIKSRVRRVKQQCLRRRFCCLF
jgi:hypothetical protein